MKQLFPSLFLCLILICNSNELNAQDYNALEFGVLIGPNISHAYDNKDRTGLESTYGLGYSIGVQAVANLSSSFSIKLRGLYERRDYGNSPLMDNFLVIPITFNYSFGGAKDLYAGIGPSYTAPIDSGFPFDPRFGGSIQIGKEINLGALKGFLELDSNWTWDRTELRDLNGDQIGIRWTYLPRTALHFGISF